MNANKILGYPVDARLLIINADDFGLCHSQNMGTIRSIQEGLVSSCSLMTPAPWSLHAIHLFQEISRIPLGVHLTIVSEYTHYRWGSLSSVEKVPSLVDESGYFMPDDRIADIVQKGDHDVMDSGRTRPEDKARVFAGLLRELPPGLSEWAFHPGIATDELEAVMTDPRIEGVSGTPQGRQSDFDFINFSEATAIIKEEGIIVQSYESMQRFWQTR